MLPLARRFCFVLVTTLLSLPAFASSKAELDAYVQETLDRLYKKSTAAKSLSKEAKGILVFPKILKAGIVIGGEYGEGALLLDNSIRQLLQHCVRFRWFSVWWPGSFTGFDVYDR